MAIRHIRPRAASLVTGFKAVQRALGLDPSYESLKTEMHNYECWKIRDLQQRSPGAYFGINEEVLEENGGR